MKKIFLLLAAIVPVLVFSQTPTENYIHTVTYKTPVQDGSQAGVPESGKNEIITYYNGSGKPKQHIVKSAGGNSEEMIQHYEYDIMGRQAKSYLPYSSNLSNPLNIVGTAKQSTITFYKAKFPQDFQNTLNPYSEVLFEKLPSGKPIIVGAPGSDWKIDPNGNPDHSLKVSYGTNNDNEVIDFGVNFTNNDYLQPVLISNGYYSTNELYLTIAKNENWKVTDGKLNTTYSYKNKEGHTILNRTYNNITGTETSHDQYYVYDDFGNLSYVLSPKAMENLFVPVSYPSFNQTINVGIGTSYAITFNGVNNQITVVFKKSLKGTPDGIVGALNVALPNTIIGYITDGLYNIRMSIENGNLVMTNLSSVAAPNTINQTLTAQITPAAGGVINTQTISDLGYQYRYDDQNRLAEKKLPGKEWEYMVYDRSNRSVLTQDALLKSTNKWLFIKYDIFGRTVYTGDYTDNRTRAQIQTGLDNSVTPLSESRTTSPFSNGGANVHYTNTAFPNTTINVFNISYYDNYTFDLDGITIPTTVYGATITTNTRGLPTGGKTRTLDTTNWTTAVSAYDSQYRTVWISTKNAYLSTSDVLESKLDFSGNLLETKTTHNKTGVITNLITYNYYTYDQVNRLLSHTQKIGTNTIELLAYNKYDELGTLIQKKTGGVPGANYAATAGLQTVDYSFNVRGWLTKINDPSNMGTDLFSFEIKYNNPTNGTALYNGNISQTFWKTANTDNSLKNYNYSYDNLNRLKEAKFFKTIGTAVTADTHNETLEYDRNGNIISLNRSGFKNDNTFDSNLDKLIYSYNGNILKSVTDSGNTTEGFDDHLTTGSTTDDYTYDNNGNLTRDRNKDITNITYNSIDLPVKITFGGTNKIIEFVYNANGTKLAKKITNGSTVSTTFYAGNYVYSQTNSNTPVLQFFNHSEGYVNVNAGAYIYVYQYKDQVGNVRLSYAKNPGNGTLQIIEENNYYAFGVKHKGYNSLSSSLGNNIANKFRYNGQESEEIFGLNVTEMDFRQYNADIGRFYNIDQLAEQAPGWTPYHFTLNNPIYFGDPSGLRQAPAPQFNAFPTWINTIWENSGDGSTLWINGGGGSFINTLTGGDVNVYTGIYTEYAFLPEVTIEISHNRGDRKREGILLQYHVFKNSPYYKFYRDQSSKNYWNDLQNTIDYLGAFPVIGDFLDGVNASISGARGNYGEAAVNAVSMIPVGGIAILVVKKIQKHHIIPKAVYKQFAELPSLIKRDDIFNLKKLPFPFHGNHPKYSDYVKEKLNELKDIDNLTKESIRTLQKDLRNLMNDALHKYEKEDSGKNLNDYFRDLLNKND